MARKLNDNKGQRKEWLLWEESLSLNRNIKEGVVLVMKDLDFLG
jgi:hypothetical protein